MGESTARIGVYADDKATPVIKSVQGHMQGLAAEAKKSILTGVGLAGGVAAFSLLQRAIGGAVDFVGNAIDAASNLAESQSKVNVVFGVSAKEITGWASTASKAFGMSTQQALEAAGTYGNLFQAFGLGRDEATKMSKTLVELAADLASFNNTSVDDALVALRSGLSGETEPLKRYGIAISDARMRTELMAQGVTNLGATLTPLQKTQAAYALILKDSTLAQGDFARTADGLANQQRILNAEMADLSAKIGTALLPIFVELAHFAVEDLVPAIEGTVDAVVSSIEWFGKLGAAITDFLNGEGAHVKSSGEMIDTLQNQFNRFDATALPRGMATAMRATEDTVTRKAPAIIKTIADIPVLAASAMLANEKTLTDAFTHLAEVGKVAMSQTAIDARAYGVLTDSRFAAGLLSNKPAVVAASKEAINNAIDMSPAALAKFSAGGWNAGKAWVVALGLGIINNQTMLVRAMGMVKAKTMGLSPPKEGPLKDIDKGGFNVGKAWADAVGLGMGGVKIPSLDSAGTRGGGGMSLAGAGGGGAAPIHIHIEGPVFGDGAFLDMLANKISDRLRFAPGT